MEGKAGAPEARAARAGGRDMELQPGCGFGGNPQPELDENAFEGTLFVLLCGAGALVPHRGTIP